MSLDLDYTRVMPRDLFNEANLLKCLGQLWLKLENQEHVGLQHYTSTKKHFAIAQETSDGSLSPVNVYLTLHGWLHEVRRPLNSREPWPLYMHHLETSDDIAIFDDAGELSSEFEAYLSYLENRSYT